MYDKELALIILFLGLSVYIITIISRNGGLSYFKTAAGKNALPGMLIAVGAFVALVIFTGDVFGDEIKSDEWEWFNSGGIHLGIDFTKDQSPQCDFNSIDNNGTSNLGAWMNIIEYGDTSVNLQYTHHSCALGVDRNTYDAMGISVRYKLWGK